MSMIKNQIAELELLGIALGDNPYHWHTVTAKELHNWEDVVDSAIGTIKELSAKVASESMERSSRYYNGGWIPCSERLPNYGVNVFVSTENDELISACYLSDGTWVVQYDGCIINDRILAWKPLPQPYEE